MANDPQQLTFLERLHDTIFACDHDFGFPIKVRDFAYPAPFNAHQTCTKCGRMRYFDVKAFLPGPFFRKRS